MSFFPWDLSFFTKLTGYIREGSVLRLRRVDTVLSFLYGEDGFLYESTGTKDVDRHLTPRGLLFVRKSRLGLH